MINKVKKVLASTLILNLLVGYQAFGETNNYYRDIVNNYGSNEIIYLLNDKGELLKLNNGMEDFVPDNLPKLSYIDVRDDSFIALTRNNNIISSRNIVIPDKVLKVDGNFFLTEDKKVSSLDSSLGKRLSEFSNVRDIKALNDQTVVLYNEDETIDIVGSKIGIIRNLTNISDITFYNDMVLVISDLGRVFGFGDNFKEIEALSKEIINGKKFINTGENLYVLTYDNKGIPIKEGEFKAKEEHLNGLSNIVLTKFSNKGGGFYKAYFIREDGGVTYYIQSDNDISEFNKKKIEHINTFTNVSNVYESGYLTIVLHKDGSINIPFNINHELNGITGVKDVELKNQSYVVYLENGQVITSLDNIVLNKLDKGETLGNDLYNYLNSVSIGILNKELHSDDPYSFVMEKDKIEESIRDMVLSRTFVMLDMGYDEIMNYLYQYILNTYPSEGEYNHMRYIMGTMEGKTKEEILGALVNYIFENPIFIENLNKLI